MDRIQSTVGGTQSVAPSQVNREGMLTDLNSVKISSDTEINDLKKARALLKAVISSNPKNSDGWIAAARVEELDGKI
jgi:pre-mRNA-processing factor 6